MRSPPAIRIRPARRVGVRDRLLRVAPAALIAYWPLDERAGTVAFDASGNGRHGAYSNVTLGAAGIGDGRTAASFNGTTSFCNVYSASLAAAINGAEGTAALWCQVADTAVWADGAQRWILTLSDAAGENRMVFNKQAVAGTLTGTYTAGGTGDWVTLVGLSATTWLHLALTWSKSSGASGELRIYAGGAQSGTTQTTLGVFTAAFAAAKMVIGASSTAPLLVWSGNLAHVALWNTALPPAQIALLAAAP